MELAKLRPVLPLADASVVMICPVVAGVPPIVCFIVGTCNGFTASDSERVYDKLKADFDEAGLTETLG